MKKILSLIIIVSILAPFLVKAVSFDVYLGKSFNVYTGKNLNVYVPTVVGAQGLIDKAEGGVIILNAGELSDTSTLSSSYDTSRSSIFFLGTNADNATNVASSSVASLYLDNGTTVRAQRGGTTNVSLEVAYWIVQWSTGVTTSVQRGETVVGSLIGTATTTLTTPVTTSRAFVNMLGSNSTSTQVIQSALFRNSLHSGDGTVVNATRGSVVSYTDIATSTWQVTEFAPGYTDSVQEVQITIANTTSSNTTSISAVTLADSILFNGGFSYSLVSGVQQSIYSTQEIVDSTTVRNRRTSTSQVNISRSTVVDFNSAYLQSNIQSGEVVLNSVTSNTATISSVNRTKSILTYNGMVNNTNNQNNVDRVLTDLNFTNNTTITGTKQNSLGIATSSFMVLESK